MAKLISLDVPQEVLDNNAGGGGLCIKVPGFKNNPASPEEGQIFIEFYDGKLRVHVWNGEQDPVTTDIEKL